MYITQSMSSSPAAVYVAHMYKLQFELVMFRVNSRETETLGV